MHKVELGGNTAAFWGESVSAQRHMTAVVWRDTHNFTTNPGNMSPQTLRRTRTKTQPLQTDHSLAHSSKRWLHTQREACLKKKKGGGGFPPTCNMKVRLQPASFIVLPHTCKKNTATHNLTVKMPQIYSQTIKKEMKLMHLQARHDRTGV